MKRTQTDTRILRFQPPGDPRGQAEMAHLWHGESSTQLDRRPRRPIRIIERLLSKPDVATVHVRTLAPQRFLYAVAAGSDDEGR